MIYFGPWNQYHQINPWRITLVSTQSGRVEIELRQQYLQYGVRYIDREKDESRNKCMKRRKLMREHIQNAHVSSKNNTIMENNGDDIDFLVEFLDKDGNSFHAPSMADQSEMKMNEISFRHANPEVHKMVQMFNDGELNHSVATCLTCHETRPQFRATKPSEKFHTENRKSHEVPSWVIIEGRWERCHKECLANKNKPDYIFTFSGHSSVNKSASQPFLKNTCYFHDYLCKYKAD